MTLTLRYLATGDSQQSQSFNFRIGRSTVHVSGIIRETGDAICTQLCHTYLPTPKTPQEWKRISEDFSTLWNFPHCLGAGDGKHVVIDCPKNSGSNFSTRKEPLPLFYWPLVM